MLTTRETQVLELIARGHSDRRVAATLVIALSTARKHRENLQRKLRAANVCALLFAAALAGELSLPLSPNGRLCSAQDSHPGSVDRGGLKQSSEHQPQDWDSCWYARISPSFRLAVSVLQNTDTTGNKAHTQ